MKNVKLKVNQVAELTGVSVRTLHHYDAIGLLSPERTEDSNYRLYGEMDLYRLQQILLYREFDMPLIQIKELLDAPDYDRIEELLKHRNQLNERKSRLNTLLNTIDKTISHLQHKTRMKTPKELYEGFPAELGTTYRKEAIKRFGKTEVEQSEQQLMNRGKDGVQALVDKLASVHRKLKNVEELRPNHEVVQEYIHEHHQLILAFWGTTENRWEAYAGLANTYVTDTRFNLTGEGYDKPFAEFLREAIAVYIKDKTANNP